MVSNAEHPRYQGRSTYGSRNKATYALLKTLRRLLCTLPYSRLLGQRSQVSASRIDVVGSLQDSCDCDSRVFALPIFAEKPQSVLVQAVLIGPDRIRSVQLSENSFPALLDFMQDMIQ